MTRNFFVVFSSCNTIIRAMKKITIVLLSIVLPLAIACASKNAEKSQAPADVSSRPERISSAKEPAFRLSDAWKKLDGRLKQAWDDAMTKGDSHKSFECLLKTKEKPTAGQKRRLSDAGFTHRSIIGQIVTGSVAATDVPEVARLPFVQVMELAVPLSPK